MPNFPSPPSNRRIFSLLATLLLISAVQSHQPTPHQRFREAPKFSNSPDCPPIPTVHSDHDPTVHVAMTLDATYLRGSMAAVLSVLQHSSCPENVRFHFVSAADGPSLRSHLSGSFPYLKFQIYPFNPSSVSGHISTSIRSALDTPLNYARNYLAEILPRTVRRVVYLDSDVVLVDDIEKLASTELPDGVVLAAPEYCNADLRSYFTPTFWASEPLAAAFAGRRACYFNTGVMVMELARWRAGGYTERIVEWMELQKRIRIYELGSLPPFLLVFAGRIAPVDHRWNQHGLGGDNFRGLCRDLHPGPVSLLHWSGKGKPWVRLDAGRPCPLDTLWAPYDLLQKGDRGSEFITDVV